ncbi:ABC transporter substrate-binding protein [Erwinia sp. CPCC 100877]|nr:ABC transporter substrate-binding protein [Erwinia sp. CPCC 100877]
MKKKIIWVSAIALSLVLVGCGKNTGTKTTEQSSTNASSVAKEDTITYLGTDYTVKFPTSKIITASLESMEDAAALSVKPLGAITVAGEIPSYLKNQLGDKVVNVGDKFGPNVESVTALNPDVILGSTKFDDKVTSNLNKIAPTINVSHKSADWEDNLKLLGTLSGKSDKAAKLITEYQNNLKAFKADHSDVSDKKILLLRIREGELCIYGSDYYYNPMLYKDLGFAAPKEVGEVNGQTTISPEQLAKIDTDIILVQFMDSENEGFTSALDDLKKDAVWKSVPAVANNQVFYNIVDGGYQGGTYLSKEVMLQAMNDQVMKQGD